VSRRVAAPCDIMVGQPGDVVVEDVAVRHVGDRWLATTPSGRPMARIRAVPATMLRRLPDRVRCAKCLPAERGMRVSSSRLSGIAQQSNLPAWPPPPLPGRSAVAALGAFMPKWLRLPQAV